MSKDARKALMIARHMADGGMAEKTVPEAPHTLAAQLQAFLEGKRKAVLYTHEEPPLPKGAKRLESPHGVFHYNPALIDEPEIKSAIAEDRINDVLGMGPYSKKDVMTRVAAGEDPLAVVGRDAGGREVLTAAGTPGTIREQAAAIAPQLPPGGQVKAESPANVLFDRIASMRLSSHGDKDARKALMIARAMGGRIAKAGGGELSLVGPTPEMAQQNPALRSQVPLETVYQSEDEQPVRTWGDLSTPPENQDQIINYEAVAPVYTSRVHELLTNPSALNRMKMGRPQQWVKYLQKGGAKPEEIKMYGIGEGDPNKKISREEVHARVDGNVPQLRERLRGEGSEEGDLEDLELRHGEWETDEPDYHWLRERASERLHDDAKDNRSDAEYMAPYIGNAIDDFSHVWLRKFNRDTFKDPNNHDPEKFNAFIQTALDGNLLSKGTAENLSNSAKAKRITTDQWQNAIDEMDSNLVRKFDNVDEGDVEDRTHHYEEAVKLLHGSDAPNISSHLVDQASEDDRKLDQYADQEAEWYYEDGEAPRSKQIWVEGPNRTKLLYDVWDSGYGGGMSVYSNNGGGHLRNVDSEDEAESLIRTHAAEKLGLGFKPEKQGNMTKPDVHQGGVYGEGSQWSLPGVTDYREHTLHYDPPSGEVFGEGHYEPNAVVHMRYGTVNDANGKRLLYLDELQSDWHQKGMGRGYNTPEGREASKLARIKHEAAEKELNSHRDHIATGLGFSGSGPGVDRYAALMLLDPNDAAMGDYNVQNSVHNAFWSAKRAGLADAMFGQNGEDLDAQSLLKNYHQYAKDAFGENYKRHASDLTSALNKTQDLRKAMTGDLVPDAPWKNTSDWSKLAMKRALRIAADYGYDGVALSPGWVQKHRWGNEDHQKTYDELMGGAMKSLAKQEGLNFGSVSIPILRKHAVSKRVSVPEPDKAQAILLEDEHKDKIRKKGFKLFKRGGYIQAKDNPAVEQALKLTSKSGAKLPASVYNHAQHKPGRRN